MKKVSIIIPIYNTEEYLDSCLESVLNQNYDNIEIIAINDGSPGNTDEIINQYIDKIHYYKKENSGIGSTRNFGLKKATGDYICFLDSDDLLKPNAIFNMIKKCEDENIDFLVTNYEDYYINTNKSQSICLVPFNNCSLKENPNLINMINLGPSNKLIKKELLNDLFFPENIKYEDFVLMLKVMDRASKIGHLNQTLFTFRKRKDGETLMVDDKVFDIFVSFEELINYFKGKYKEEIDYFLVKNILLYATKQKYQINKRIKNVFINEAYEFLCKYVPYYKNNKYFKECSLIKRMIQKNKLLLMIYCKIGV